MAVVTPFQQSKINCPDYRLKKKKKLTSHVGCSGYLLAYFLIKKIAVAEINIAWSNKSLATSVMTYISWLNFS